MTNIDPLDIAIGQKLRSFRLRNSLSQRELGETMGVTFQQIQKYESGKNKLSMKVVHRLCNHYDVSPLQFFDGFEKDMLKSFNLEDKDELARLIRMNQKIKSTLLRNAAVVIMGALAKLSEGDKNHD